MAAKKTVKSIIPTCYLWKGFENGSYAEYNFSAGEKELALSFSVRQEERGYVGVCYHRTYDGAFKNLFGKLKPLPRKSVKAKAA